MPDLLLVCNLSPGDIMTMTAAVENLHLNYPDQYRISVTTSAPEIWEHNPLITPIECAQSLKVVQMQYPTVHHSNQRTVAFINGFTVHLAHMLQCPIKPKVNRPHLYISEEERSWIPQVDGAYWLINAGYKQDFTIKVWPSEYYEEVVDRTRSHIRWVQIGANEHTHPLIPGCLDLRGQTDHRQLIRLVYHARGGLGPVTYLQHLCAAWEKPYLCLVGGREPLPWIQYPLQYTFHTLGQLDCCRLGACWKSRVVALDDGSEQDKSLCDQPVFGFKLPIAKCMASISPKEVVTVLQRLVGGFSC